MSRYLVTGFNSETGEIYRGEEQDQQGAEHLAVSWCELQPLGSHATVLESLPNGHINLRLAAQAKRVLGGVEWL